MADGHQIGVVVMAYGTPASPSEIEAYYTHIRHGRPPTAEQLEDLRRRYAVIGGTSPLSRVTHAQVAGIAAELGADCWVELGMKHASPFIEDAVGALVERGASRAVAIVLAPHYSALSVGEYLDRARGAAGEHMAIIPVRSWHSEAEFVALLSERVCDAMTGMPEGTEVIFTAHSLPERIAATDDPYPTQLAETAAAVADRAGITHWSTGWQSAGRTPEPWLGPDICDVIRERAACGTPAILVCPAGFVADHLEVLYDLDVQAHRVADEAGMAFARTASLNDDPRFCAMLARVVREHAEESE